MATEARHVKLLALAHDGKVLASRLHWDKDPASSEQYEDVLRTIFESPGWAAVREQRKNKLELKSGSNIYCIEIDSSGRTYVAVITRAYPIRHIFSVSAATSTTPKLMAEFAAYIVAHHGPESIASGVGGLRRTLRPFLRDLAARFDDLEGIDKLAAATTKVAALQTTLSAAVHAATERSSLLEAADARTREVDTGARRMYRRSATLQRRACWARWTLCCFAIAAVVVLLALVGLLLGLNYGLLHWW